MLGVRLEPELEQRLSVLAKKTNALKASWRESYITADFNNVL